MGDYVYIGDLSKIDASVIAEYARNAKSVLEFGIGGSTQIFAQCCPLDAEILCLDTSKEWIEFTKEVFKDLQIDRQITILNYNQLSKIKGKSFDIIFDDGLGRERLNFAFNMWPLLNPNGGKMIFHDTRRPNDIKNVCKVMEAFYNQISMAELNKNHSNISILTKKPPEPYVNWNRTEDKQNWMKSARITERPSDWFKQLRDFIWGN